MRQIKFRAIVPVNSGEPKSMQYFDLSKVDDCNRLAYADYDANQLMQFTGLLDKSEKEIYESDIVKDLLTGVLYEVRFGFNRHLSLTGWHVERKQIDIVHRLNPDYDTNVNSQIEVVGNVFENPDLLK